MTFDPLSALSTLFAFVRATVRYMRRWLGFRRPAAKVLEGAIDQRTKVKIFVKDFVVRQNVFILPKLVSREGSRRQANPNIRVVWSEAAARGVADLFNLFGQLDKYANLSVVTMSQGHQDWEGTFFVIGAQAIRSQVFYRTMINVGYAIDNRRIFDLETGETVIDPHADHQHRYGLIIKARNSNANSQGQPVFLLGGHGTLGTEAALYYFCNELPRMGKEFKRDCFSIIIRANIDGGKQTAQRITELTKRYPSARR